MMRRKTNVITPTSDIVVLYTAVVIDLCLIFGISLLVLLMFVCAVGGMNFDDMDFSVGQLA